MSYGITDTGFNAKSLTTIKGEIEDALRAVFGQQLNTEPSSNVGQFVGIMSEALAELWELFETLYVELTVDGATGAQLDNLAGLTGTVREAATKTRVLATLSGSPEADISAGSVATVAGSGTRFVLTRDVTLNGGGTLTGVEFVAEQTGPMVCPAGSLTVIATPVSGWVGITNPADAFVLGTDLEADTALRLRREIELRASGNAALEPVRQRVLAADNAITQCKIFSNDTNATDGDGLPPHSIEVLVQGGADAAIAQAIFSSKAAGIQTRGSSSHVVTDTEGNAHTIYFSRPTVINVYLGFDITTISADYPADGDVQVAAAVALYGDTKLTIGSDIVPSALSAQCFRVSGVDEVNVVNLGTSASPTGTTRIAIGPRELADLDTSRIVVAS